MMIMFVLSITAIISYI